MKIKPLLSFVNIVQDSAIWIKHGVKSFQSHYLYKKKVLTEYLDFLFLLFNRNYGIMGLWDYGMFHRICLHRTN